MASHVKNEAFYQILLGDVHFDTDDIRVSLHMTNTTIDTEVDSIATNTDFSTPDEFDGANYSSPGSALASKAVAKDDSNDRATFDAADLTWSSLGVGTRDLAGALVYLFVTNWASSIPLAWFEFSATPDGSDFTIQWNSVGLLALS